VWVWFGLVVAHFTLQGLIAWAVLRGSDWLAWLLVLPLAHVMHGHLLAFHEAAHATLCPRRFWNELFGTVVGIHSFMSLALFRHVHTQHHVFLTSERDEELWPFVAPSMPRWQRVGIALLELSLGLFYTPVLFLRSFLRKDTTIRDPRLRRRIRLELALAAGFAGAALAATVHYDAWKVLLFAYLLPALLAGNLQTARKFIEHMGLTGTTILGVTRSIVPRSRLGRWMARSMFNISYHGVHHRYARLHASALPEFEEMLRPDGDGELPPFSSYRQALADMLRSLSNPRIGVQWQADAPTGRVRIGEPRRSRSSPRAHCDGIS
jgi:fatty acid desaturase